MIMTNKSSSTQVKNWSRFKFPNTLYKYSALLLILVFLTYSLTFMKVSIPKMFTAMGGLLGVIADRY